MCRWWWTFHCYVWSWRVVVTGALITGRSWIMSGLSTFSNQQLVVIACDCIITGWLVVYLPLWKVWISQLGWWHSQLNGKYKIPWFQTTNQLGALPDPPFSSSSASILTTSPVSPPTEMGHKLSALCQKRAWWKPQTFSIKIPVSSTVSGLSQVCRCRVVAAVAGHFNCS